MKKQIFFPLLLCLALLAALSGCGGETPAAEVVEPTPEVTEAPKTGEEIAREFLEIYLTADYEGRYTDYLANSESIEDYHDCVRPYLTDELYEKMCNNRTMLRYDEAAAQLGVSLTLGKIDTVGCARGGKGTFFADVSSYGVSTRYQHTIMFITGEITITDDGMIKNIVFWYQDPIPGEVEFIEGGRDTAAEFFREYYTQKADSEPELDFSPMNLEQLAAMTSSTVGTVVDTRELSIEVLGAMFSGNTAEITLLATAKELESVIPDGSTDSRFNYCFIHTDTFMDAYTLDDQRVWGWTEYIYSDTDETLAPNQFKLHYMILNDKPITNEIFSIPLVDFGCYRKGSGYPESLYEDSWQVDIAVDVAKNTGTLVRPKKEIRIGDYGFAVEDIQISPLGGLIHFTCTEDLAFIEEHQDEINELFFRASDSFTLTLSDGTQLVGNDHFDISANASLMFFGVDFFFHGPVAVEDIESITMFGEEFPLS